MYQQARYTPVPARSPTPFLVPIPQPSTLLPSVPQESTCVVLDSGNWAIIQQSLNSSLATEALPTGFLRSADGIGLRTINGCSGCFLWGRTVAAAPPVGRAEGVGGGHAAAFGPVNSPSETSPPMQMPHIDSSANRENRRTEQSSRHRKRLLAASAGLCVAVSVGYFWQPDWLAPVTLVLAGACFRADRTRGKPETQTLVPCRTDALGFLYGHPG